MKKISILLAATAMALGLYSCDKGGNANLKDNADSVSYAVGFGNASELVNAIKGAQAQGENVDSALFSRALKKAQQRHHQALVLRRSDAGCTGCYALQGRLCPKEGYLHGRLQEGSERRLCLSCFSG